MTSDERATLLGYAQFILLAAIVARIGWWLGGVFVDAVRLAVTVVAMWAF